jgi:hypothetical protein
MYAITQQDEGFATSVGPKKIYDDLEEAKNDYITFAQKWYTYVAKEMGANEYNGNVSTHNGIGPPYLFDFDTSTVIYPAIGLKTIIQRFISLYRLYESKVQSDHDLSDLKESFDKMTRALILDGFLLKETCRDLSKHICKLLIKYNKENPDMFSLINDNITLNIPLLASWCSATNLEVLNNEQTLDAALGYENFCMQVVTFETAKKHITHCRWDQ